VSGNWLQMRVSNNSVDRVREGQRLAAFLRFELVAVGGGRGTRELLCRFTFEDIRCDPTQEIGWDRYVVAIRRSSHLGAVTRPPETNAVVSDVEVSTVADAGCMFHVRGIDTPTLAAELTQS
jgi:hypothetical protein